MGGWGGGRRRNLPSRRYDGVLHLVTAAKGAADFYKWGKVTDDAGRQLTRRESPAEACELDATMERVWRPHARQIVVANAPGGSFDAKLASASAAVLKICLESHPQEWRKAHGGAGRWWWPFGGWWPFGK